MMTRLLQKISFLFFLSSRFLPSAYSEDELVELVPHPVYEANASIFEIIANPVKFSSTEVGLVGFIGLRDRSRLSVLYISSESHEYEIYSNGIYLFFEAPLDELNEGDIRDGDCVLIRGVVETEAKEIRKFISPLVIGIVKDKILRVTEIHHYCPAKAS